MSPSQFMAEFPKATKSRLVDQSKLKELVDGGACKVRITERKYSSPIGMTVSGDLRGGAKGVDEWVAADGGNAYAIRTYDWVNVGDRGKTQLVVTFDTLYCN